MDHQPIKVLLVEDNPGDVRLICEMLAHAPEGRFEVESFARLCDAAPRLAQSDADVALLDLSLPDSQGLETFAQAQRQAPQLPIAVLTGLDDQEMAIQAVQAGAQDYLVKGQVDGNLLVRSIRYAITRKRTEQEREHLLAAERAQRELVETLRAVAERRLEELERTQSQLIQSAKMAAVGQLAAGVAHELNNPLQSVLGMAELVLATKALDDQTREDLEIIVEESRRARDIVRQLVEFSRQSEPHKDREDVNDLLQQTLSLLRQHFATSGIALREEYADVPLLRLDAARMKQVFLNLLTNAAQAMPDGGQLTVRSGCREDRVWVAVADTGAGIAPEDLPYVFDPFFTTKPVGQGTGLGLSVSLGIVEDHGGTIEVETAVDGGTEFVVVLPLHGEGHAR